jgi:hypothetical protein
MEQGVQTQKNKLIKFLIDNKIPLREGIKILEETDVCLVKKFINKEKQVIYGYETREVAYGTFI